MPGLACEDGVKWTLTYPQVCKIVWYRMVFLNGVESPLIINKYLAQTYGLI
jgi:hypothetical protein